MHPSFCDRVPSLHSDSTAMHRARSSCRSKRRWSLSDLQSTLSPSHSDSFELKESSNHKTWGDARAFPAVHTARRRSWCCPLGTVREREEGSYNERLEMCKEEWKWMNPCTRSDQGVLIEFRCCDHFHHLTWSLCSLLANAPWTCLRVSASNYRAAPKLAQAQWWMMKG